eukprot:jgi/Chrzof1/8951/Cz03g30130.t1
MPETLSQGPVQPGMSTVEPAPDSSKPAVLGHAQQQFNGNAVPDVEAAGSSAPEIGSSDMHGEELGTAAAAQVVGIHTDSQCQGAGSMRTSTCSTAAELPSPPSWAVLSSGDVGQPRPYPDSTANSQQMALEDTRGHTHHQQQPGPCQVCQCSQHPGCQRLHEATQSPQQSQHDSRGTSSTPHVQVHSAAGSSSQQRRRQQQQLHPAVQVQQVEPPRRHLGMMHRVVNAVASMTSRVAFAPPAGVTRRQREQVQALQQHYQQYLQQQVTAQEQQQGASCANV